MAAASLALSRGSHLTVLTNRDKSLWPEVTPESASRISDEEMARINIDAVAAMVEWIALHRADGGGRGGEG